MITISGPLSDELEERRVTKWMRPGHRDETSYGTVSDLTWCEKEAARRGDCELCRNLDTSMICLIENEKQSEENV